MIKLNKDGEKELIVKIEWFIRDASTDGLRSPRESIAYARKSA